MKIFQVVPYYPPHVGGMEFYVAFLCKQLSKMGHEVKVFTSSDKNYSYYERVDGVEICRLKLSSRFYNVPIATSLLSTLLREEKPDIVDTHQYPIYFSDVSTLYSTLRNVPLVLHVHVIPDAKSAFSGCISNAYYRTFEKWTLYASRFVVAPSLAYEKILAKMGVDAARIAVVPYGVDLQRFHPSQQIGDFRKMHNLGDSKVLLTVGRLNYQKGFQYLLLAMPLVRRCVPDVKLIIVGAGELLTSLRNLSHSLGLDNSVIFTGALSQLTINEAYESADVFVLPSLFESLGISLLEAQAMAKPVVGTRVGGLPEAMVEGKSGLLVEPKKPTELAEAIVTLLRDQNLAKSMGQYGRKFVEERYDLEKSISRVAKLYENIKEN